MKYERTAKLNLLSWGLVQHPDLVREAGPIADAGEALEPRLPQYLVPMGISNSTSLTVELPVETVFRCRHLVVC